MIIQITNDNNIQITDSSLTVTYFKLKPLNQITFFWVHF